MAAACGHPLLRILQTNVSPRQIENTAVGVIEGSSQISGKLSLQNNSHTLGGDIFPALTEDARRGVGKQEPASRGDLSCARQGGIGDTISKCRELNVVLADSPGEA